MADPRYAFVIMPIGRNLTDQVYETGIKPAIKASGLDVRRMNKHSKGGWVNGEIISLIEGAELIVADLTFARPNCYLEVGYALAHHRVGLGENPRLILAAHESHLRSHPDFNEAVGKIHFDL